MKRKNNFAQLGYIDLINNPELEGLDIKTKLENIGFNGKLDSQYEFKYKKIDRINIFVLFDGYKFPDEEYYIEEFKKIPEKLKSLFVYDKGEPCYQERSNYDT